MNTLGILASIAALTAGVQQDPSPLDSLLHVALRDNPRISAAQARVRASESRVSSSGTLPDPILSLGIQNFPISDPGFDDLMTMKSIAVSMSLPYPGKVSLGEEAARNGVLASQAALEDLRLDVRREVQQAWYDLAFIDRSTEVAQRHLDMLSTLVAAVDVQYAVGTAGQEDVLTAGVEATALADELQRLAARRRAVGAVLNQLLDQDPSADVIPASVPERIMDAAVATTEVVGFLSDGSSDGAGTSPLRPLNEVLSVAMANNPSVREHLAGIEAQRARRDLAGKVHLPDFGLMLSYGQRNDRSDMMSFSVAIPLSLNRGARQNAWVTDAEAQLATAQAEHAEHMSRLSARVTELYSDLERDRTSLMLLASGMVPQGAAALQAATAGFSVGRTDFQTVMANQAALFRFETAFHKAVTDFAKNVAEMERLVDEEILR
jgi:cobalt-zinc-cadmium efflux system outer membrane protein